MTALLGGGERVFRFELLHDERVRTVDVLKPIELIVFDLDLILPLDGRDAWPAIAQGARSPHDAILLNAAPDSGGIRAGDVIIKLEEAQLATPADISSRMRTLHGKSAPLILMRDHREVTVTVTVSDDDPGRIQITPFQLNPNQF